ncbi:MAG: molybdopterin synthase [Halococcoides sp.]
MQTLAVVGPSDSGKTTLVSDLVERLDAIGQVATVKHLTHEPDIDTSGKDTSRHRDAGATHTVGVTDDGSWFGTGEHRTLSDVIDRLTPQYDYCLIEGYSQSTHPKVVLGGDEAADPVIERAPNADQIDRTAVIDALQETDPVVTLESLVEEVTDRSGAEFAGAIATFTGRVRRRDGPDDEPTEHLEFERYDSVAADRMAQIQADLEDRAGVHAVGLHHRTGVVEAGEDVVYVVAMAGHREQAFTAAADGIDRVKDEVPLFKKEVTVDGSFWRHERPE